MADIASALTDDLERHLGLDSLGHDGQIEAVGQIDDSLHEATSRRVVLHSDHKRLVDLECVDGEGAQHSQARAAGAERWASSAA